jgi:glucosamine--fructose-6-phosphate aminotransferase (isomerizing)
MNPLLKEIDEIPGRAAEFLQLSPDYKLPVKVPYLGMGSSYFAPLAFLYMGMDIMPEIASEYFNYIHQHRKGDKAVILSQSGESSEALWCTGLFREFTAITNNPGSTLAKHPKAQNTVILHAGDEKYSSSKTYINTLLALFRGFGINAGAAVDLLNEKINEYRKVGEKLADEIYRLITGKKIHGIYITGSGPNIATALESSLILSESTRICFTGLPMAQYDHGPKETARDSIVIQINSRGTSYDRSMHLSEIIAKAGAYVFAVEETGIEENFSVINNIVPFNYLAAFLAGRLGITETFTIGGKITTVP